MMKRKGRPPNTSRSFWSKVEIRGADECWPWQGSTKNGYGRYKEGGVEIYAHHYAHRSTGGEPVSIGHHLMHSCNTKRCCNPGHLRLGTPQKNTQDAYRDGLICLPRGERHHNAKLTEAQVRVIRADRRPLSVVSAEYGIGVMTASNIRNRKIWKHVP